MVKATYVDENGVKKGAWTEEEDNKLRAYIQRYGHWNWRLLPRFAGLERSGQSCRLRWMNYLKPGLKRGDFSLEERDLIIKLHQELGNKWSAIAAKLPGRTDNDIKNYWQCIQKRESGTSKSGQQAEISQFQQEFAGSDARNCAAPNLRSREHEKSNASSSDVFILDTSSSNQSVFSGAVDWNLTSSLGQNWCSSSDLLSGLDESFWNQPFVVDTCFYNHHYNNFCTLDEGDLLSPPLPCFDDDDDNMF